MRHIKRAGWAAKLLILSPLLLSRPVAAEVVTKSDIGFVVRLAAEVTAPPPEAWRTLTTPSQWWSSQHTFSGEAANLTFDPVVGGCFCETLPRPEGAPASQKPASQKPGGVQHMRIVYIEPPRAMRLTGALGPLQSEALSATMTMTVKPTDTPAGKGSRILFEYVVGGFMRYKVDEIAPAVDRMLAAQLLSLAGKLGPVAEPATAAAPAAAPVGPPAPDAELEPKPPAAKPPAAKPLVPLRGAGNYSLPPSRRTGNAPAAQPPATKPPVADRSVASPVPAPAITPAPAAEAAARPAVKVPAKAPVKPVAKPPVKAPAKTPVKRAPKAVNPDDAAHLDANARVRCAARGLRLRPEKARKCAAALSCVPKPGKHSRRRMADSPGHTGRAPFPPVAH